VRIVLLIPVVFVLAGVGCVFATFDDLTESGSSRPTPERCGECHQEIYAEWSESAHARSYSSPSFEAYTSDHRFGDCLPCHAPDSLYAGGVLSVRDTEPHHGVDCVACHLDGDALVGPLPSSAVFSPHDVRQDRESYRKSDMCGRCHTGTFEEWQDAKPPAPDGGGIGKNLECQECHMPRVTRTVTQADDALSSVFVALETEHTERRHRFDLAAMQGFEAAAEVRATFSEEGLIVIVTNLLPHSLPTGDYGPSRVEARITFLGADGASVGEETLLWSGRHSGTIPAYGRDRKVVPIVEGAVRCEVVLLRPACHDGRDLVLAHGEVDFR
jgi:hypothetical protein